MINTFKRYEKIKNGKTILIFSPNNGALLYYLFGWYQVLNFIGYTCFIVYDKASALEVLKSKRIDVIINVTDDSVMENFSYEIINDYNNFCTVLSIGQLSGKILKQNFSISSFSDSGADIRVMFGFNPFVFNQYSYSKIIPWFFVGTNSYLKMQRFDEWIYPIIQQFPGGVLAGVGWASQNVGALPLETTNIFYNISKINFNLHLDNQISEKNEVNERTHVISACGGFQIVDNPKLIYDMYDNNEVCICESKEEYAEKFRYYLLRDSERDIMRQAAYKKAWEKYSMFSTMEDLITFIDKL